MTPIPVPAHGVDDWLPMVEWHFESFCENGIYQPEDLVADIKDRKRQLWIAVSKGEVKAVLLTSISDDRLKTCMVTHCAGENARAWLHLFNVIEEWARAEGCKRIEATTRPGWEKLLGRFDMAKTHVVLEKRL
ncbi:MAG: hypothetical protein ACPG4X_15825 [Pikeienuella sp.]